MAKILGGVALLALIVTLAFTLLEIMKEPAPTADLLKLTQLLLSWPVIAGGVGMGAAATFKGEIRGMLSRIAKP